MNEHGIITIIISYKLYCIKTYLYLHFSVVLLISVFCLLFIVISKDNSKNHYEVISITFILWTCNETEYLVILQICSAFKGLPTLSFNKRKKNPTFSFLLRILDGTRSYSTLCQKKRRKHKRTKNKNEIATHLKINKRVRTTPTQDKFLSEKKINDINFNGTNIREHNYIMEFIKRKTKQY